MTRRQTYRVACLAGHGIGPEVMAEASRALAHVSSLHGFSNRGDPPRIRRSRGHAVGPCAAECDSERRARCAVHPRRVGVGARARRCRVRARPARAYGSSGLLGPGSDNARQPARGRRAPSGRWRARSRSRARAARTSRPSAATRPGVPRLRRRPRGTTASTRSSYRSSRQFRASRSSPTDSTWSSPPGRTRKCSSDSSRTAVPRGSLPPVGSPAPGRASSRRRTAPPRTSQGRASPTRPRCCSPPRSCSARGSVSAGAAETLTGAVLGACSNGTQTPDMLSRGLGATTREFADVVLAELPLSLTNAEFYREALA